MLEMKKITVGLMLLGAMLASSAYAAAPGAPAGPSLSRDLPVQSASATKKNESLQSKKSKASNKVGAIKTAPKAKKRDSMTETPSESADQSVQLRGVRG
jgi:hypothetical protein